MIPDPGVVIPDPGTVIPDPIYLVTTLGIPFCKVISSRAASEPTQVAPNSEILQGSISVTMIIIAGSRVQSSSLQQPQMVSFTRILYPVCCNRQQINQNTTNSSQRSKHHSIPDQSCSGRHVGFRDRSTSRLSGIHFCHLLRNTVF